MDNLPDPPIVMILSRLNDSTELARCKCVSKTLNRLARQVPWIHLYCSLNRFIKMHSPAAAESSSKVTPLKTVFYKLISNAEAPIESVSLGREESPRCCYHHCNCKLVNVCDDFYLTAAGPYTDDDGWITKIGHGLKSISIKPFSSKWLRRETNILEVLSHNCHSLVEFRLKYARLTLDDMHLMPLLTRLTLEYVSISNESLNKLMQCLPCLQVLNFIYGSEDRDLEIHHLNLKELKWKLSPEYSSSITLFAPNLSTLELECDRITSLSIHAPLLSYFRLALQHEYGINVEKFKTLKTLCLVSYRLHYILSAFPCSTTVQNLTLGSPGECDEPPLDEMVNFSNVFTIFPNITSLTVSSFVWSQLIMYPSDRWAPMGEVYSERLKQITGYLVLDEIDKIFSFILYLKRICSKLTDIVLFFDFDVDSNVASSFVSLCMNLCPEVRFRWGTWKEGKDSCISSSIVGVLN